MLVATPVALFAGVFAVTVGAEMTVVKLQETAEASATPSAAWTAVLRLAVYVVLWASAADVVVVAVVPLSAAVAAAAPKGPVSVNDEVVIVVASIALENVAVGAAVIATPVALFAGVV